MTCWNLTESTLTTIRYVKSYTTRYSYTIKT